MFISVCLCRAVPSPSVLSDSSWPCGMQPARPLCPWGFSRQNCWRELLCPPPGDLPNSGVEPCLLNCRGILYRLRHQGSPRILGCVAHPFLRGSFWPRNQTEVSWTAGGFFSSWATRESPLCIYRKTISVQGRDHWLCWVVNYVI